MPPQAGDFPALASKDCVEVVEFYLEALSSHEYAQAALVWDDPVIDAARLEAVFGAYKEAQVEWPDPFVEGAAGSLYCTVSGKLSDAGDPAKPPLEGTLLLRRVNDVPGATPDQLRWTLRSSTFVEKLERSNTGRALMRRCARRSASHEQRNKRPPARVTSSPSRRSSAT